MWRFPISAVGVKTLIEPVRSLCTTPDAHLFSESPHLGGDSRINIANDGRLIPNARPELSISAGNGRAGDLTFLWKVVVLWRDGEAPNSCGPDTAPDQAGHCSSEPTVRSYMIPIPRRPIAFDRDRSGCGKPHVRIRAGGEERPRPYRNRTLERHQEGRLCRPPQQPGKSVVRLAEASSLIGSALKPARSRNLWGSGAAQGFC